MKITIQELIARPIIRPDQSFKWLSKMTLEEAKAFDSELDERLHKKGIPYSFPEWNANVMSAMIDREVLYEIILVDNRNKRKDEKLRGRNIQ